MSATSERPSSTSYTPASSVVVVFKEAKVAVASGDTSARQVAPVNTVVAPSGVMSAKFSTSSRPRPDVVRQDTTTP